MSGLSPLAPSPLIPQRAFMPSRPYLRFPSETLKNQSPFRSALSTTTSSPCSEHGDERPVSACSLSPDPSASLLITGGWSGLIKVWSIPKMEQQTMFRAHAERITDVAFHPSPAIGMDSDAPDLATASADMTAKLWTLKGKRWALYSFCFFVVSTQVLFQKNRTSHLLLIPKPKPEGWIRTSPSWRQPLRTVD
jgi:WD40 repeat protein